MARDISICMRNYKPLFVLNDYSDKFFTNEFVNDDKAAVLAPLAYSSMEFRFEEDDADRKPRAGFDLNSVGLYLWDTIGYIPQTYTSEEESNHEDFQTFMDYAFPRNAELDIKTLISQSMCVPFILMKNENVVHKEVPQYIHLLLSAAVDTKKKCMYMSVDAKFSDTICFSETTDLETVEKSFNDVVSTYEFSSLFTTKGKFLYDKKTNKTRYKLDKLTQIPS